MTLTKPQYDALLRLSRGAKTIEHPATRVNLTKLRLVQRIAPRQSDPNPRGRTRKEYELTEAGRTAIGHDERRR